MVGKEEIGDNRSYVNGGTVQGRGIGGLGQNMGS